MKKKKLTFGSALLIVLLLVIYLLLPSPEEKQVPTISLDQVPAYSGEPFVVLGGNIPQFAEEDYTTDSFEEYGPLDGLAR